MIGGEALGPAVVARGAVGATAHTPLYLTRNKPSKAEHSPASEGIRASENSKRGIAARASRSAFRSSLTVRVRYDSAQTCTWIRIGISPSVILTDRGFEFLLFSSPRGHVVSNARFVDIVERGTEYQTKYRVAMTTVAPAVPCAPVRGRLSHEPAEPARAPRTSPNFTDVPITVALRTSPTHSPMTSKRRPGVEAPSRTSPMSPSHSASMYRRLHPMPQCLTALARSAARSPMVQR